MKFKDPKTGEVFEDIRGAGDAFCRERERCDDNCPLKKASEDDSKPWCIEFEEAHPAEAACLMGYEVVEDPQEEMVGEMEGNHSFSIKDANMDKQKPLKDWTLGEVQEYCNSQKNDCHGCRFDGERCAMDQCPESWDLTEKPRFTEQEVADARAIVRLFSRELWTTLKRCVDDTLWVQGNGGAFMNINNERFKSLLPGDSVKLSEIVGGET